MGNGPSTNRRSRTLLAAILFRFNHYARLFALTGVDEAPRVPLVRKPNVVVTSHSVLPYTTTGHPLVAAWRTPIRQPLRQEKAKAQVLQGPGPVQEKRSNRAVWSRSVHSTLRILHARNALASSNRLLETWKLGIIDMADLYFSHLVQLACSKSTCSPRNQNRTATLKGIRPAELDVLLNNGIVYERLVIGQKLFNLNLQKRETCLVLITRILPLTKTLMIWAHSVSTAREVASLSLSPGSSDRLLCRLIQILSTMFPCIIA